MSIKFEIEQRIFPVASYSGTQDLPAVLASKFNETTIGSSPDWLVARACMTPEEYADYGQDGYEWRFLAGKADLARNCRDAARRVVGRELASMGLRADWSKCR
jgi:hypothetical protein